MPPSLRLVTLGVGHLRKQVSFYGSNLGLKVEAKGRVPGDVCRRLWGVDEHLDVVALGRADVPEGLGVRLIRTSDLAARPDFDLTVPGPVGFLYGTHDLQRLYYRLSGAGVEFHSEPLEVDSKGSQTAEGRSRRVWGRAYDGEYIVLSESEEGGTVSPYFGVTEPRSLILVVADLAAAGMFLADGLGQRMVTEGLASGAAWTEVMGLPAGTELRWRHFATPDGAGTTLLHFDDGQSATHTRPPDRGICSLRFDVEDLDAALARAAAAGGRRVTEPAEIDHPALGTGRAAAVESPLGVFVELWETRTVSS